jgi:DNA-binding NarL/FixJ family response regulator
LAIKKTAPLARQLNGQRSPDVDGTWALRPGQAARPTVARGQPDEPHGLARLSPRQLAAINLLFIGLTYREISESLGISMFTVRSHLHSAYKRLQVKSRGQAVAKILREASRHPGLLREGQDLASLYSHSATVNLFNPETSSGYATGT